MRLRRKPPEIPPVPTDPYLLHRYATETTRMCNEQWARVFNPFAWRKWSRMHRIIKARNTAVMKELDRIGG